jgi:competence protein ComFC
MLSIIFELLTHSVDTLFPPSAAERKLRSISATSFISHYQPQRINNTISLASYQEPLIRTAIIENKFSHSRLAAQLLARLVDHWVSKQSQPVVFVPIPLGTNRQRTRGHNQVESILKETRYQKFILKALSRTRNTTPQTDHLRTTRLKNVTGAFSHNTNIKLPEKSTIVLIDDVLTTGATMTEARTALAPHIPLSSKLTCLAVAH